MASCGQPDAGAGRIGQQLGTEDEPADEASPSGSDRPRMSVARSRSFTVIVILSLQATEASLGRINRLARGRPWRCTSSTQTPVTGKPWPSRGPLGQHNDLASVAIQRVLRRREHSSTSAKAGALCAGHTDLLGKRTSWLWQVTSLPAVCSAFIDASPSFRGFAHRVTAIGLFVIGFAVGAGATIPS
jgi:hypothetical protein